MSRSLFEVHLSTGGGSDLIHLYCPDEELITHMRRLLAARCAKELVVRRHGVHLFTLLSESHEESLVQRSEPQGQA
jgi:hypothetical protein